MGYMRHHAIVVTGYDHYDTPSEGQPIDVLHATVLKLQERFPSLCWISPVSPAGLAINGYRSFFIAPDGSKEGWTDSDNGDVFRNKVVQVLERNRNCHYAEIQFADDEGCDFVTRKG